MGRAARAPPDREQKGGDGVGVEKGYRGRPGAGSPVGSEDIGEETYARNTDAGGLTRYERGRRVGLSARLGRKRGTLETSKWSHFRRGATHPKCNDESDQEGAIYSCKPVYFYPNPLKIA